MFQIEQSKKSAGLLTPSRQSFLKIIYRDGNELIYPATAYVVQQLLLRVAFGAHIYQVIIRHYTVEAVKTFMARNIVREISASVGLCYYKEIKNILRMNFKSNLENDKHKRTLNRGK